jgi:hypothetical protein
MASGHSEASRHGEDKEAEEKGSGAGRMNKLSERDRLRQKRNGGEIK